LLKDKISLRQLLALLFAALLSPAASALPGETAAIAGSAAWLAPLFALPFALAMCWVVWAMLRKLSADAGLAEAFEAALGAVAGRIITGIYFIWCLFILMYSTRIYGQRLMVAGYREASRILFLVALLAVVLWLSWGKLTAFVRAGEIFCMTLAVVLGGVLLLSLYNMKMSYVLPVWLEDVPNLAAAAVAVLKVFSYAVFAGFLGGRVTRRPTDARRSAGWTAAFCAALILLLLAVLGQFGPTLTARLDASFFQMVAGVGVRGAFQRLEAAVAALWVISDLALLGLLVFSCRFMLTSVFRLKKNNWTVIPVVILAFIGALAFSRAPEIAESAANIGKIGSLVLSFGVLPLTLLILKLRRRV